VTRHFPTACTASIAIAYAPSSVASISFAWVFRCTSSATSHTSVAARSGSPSPQSVHAFGGGGARWNRSSVTAAASARVFQLAGVILCALPGFRRSSRMGFAFGAASSVDRFFSAFGFLGGTDPIVPSTRDRSRKLRRIR
jgi:hypothetical protein